MSLEYVDLLSCGGAPTVCLAAGFVAFFPVLRSPAGSGCAGSCGFSSPIWGHPCWVEAGFLLNRNEGLVCSSFPFGLFFHVATALRDLVTIRVKCVGQITLVSVLRLSLVLSPLPFWMGFEPLSETKSLRAVSLREVLALSIVLPWPMVWLHDHLHYP